MKRNDDLTALGRELGLRLNAHDDMLGSGWLLPHTAWAIYLRYGVAKELIKTIALHLTGKGFDLVRPDVEYDWGGIGSDLEDVGWQEAAYEACLFAFVFGGSAIFFDVDDTDWPLDTPLELMRVRELRGLRVLTVNSLRPHPIGSSFQDATHFTDATGQRKIHRSRLAIFTADDVPLDLYGMGWSVSSTTGFPPSILEAWIKPLGNWERAERSSGRLLDTMSLLVLHLAGWADAMNSPSEQEQAEAKKLVDRIAQNLDLYGLLTLDGSDKLGEVGRKISGAQEVVDGKSAAFVAAVGWPVEWVTGKHQGGLNNGEGPLKQANAKIAAMQPPMLTKPVTQVVDILLAARHHDDYSSRGDYPTKYQVKHRPLEEKTDTEDAEEREKASAARERDAKAGVPQEVIWSDPDLAKRYPEMAEFNEKRRLAAEANVPDPGAPQEGEKLVSAQQMAEQLGVKAATVIAMIKAGTIPGWKFGSRWRVPPKRVLAVFGGKKAAELAAVEMEKQVGDSLPPGLDLSMATSFGSVAGASAAMREIYTVLERISPTMISVLITGEPGTGKEGIARGVHDHSSRRGMPFVAVNCGALGWQVDDVARQLLGEGDVPGLFEQANGGTIFLDEVGELSIDGQAVLLRALTGDVRRLSSTQSVKVDVRVVAATNRDIGQSHCFRRDLFDRLAGVVVEVPPLREREDDILMLADLFLERVAAEQRMVPAPRFSADARAVMRHHAWPGNVRQLNAAVRLGAVLAGAGGTIHPEHLQLQTGREAA